MSGERAKLKFYQRICLRNAVAKKMPEHFQFESVPFVCGEMDRSEAGNFALSVQLNTASSLRQVLSSEEES